MKKILLYLLFASFTYGVTETCPIMKDEENDPEATKCRPDVLEAPALQSGLRLIGNTDLRGISLP